MLISEANENYLSEYKDILLYKSAILTAAALIYGWIPLHRGRLRITGKLKQALREILSVIPILRGGMYWQLLDKDYRFYLNEVEACTAFFVAKNAMLGIMEKLKCRIG